MLNKSDSEDKTPQKINEKTDKSIIYKTDILLKTSDRSKNNSIVSKYHEFSHYLTPKILSNESINPYIEDPKEICKNYKNDEN